MEKSMEEKTKEELIEEIEFLQQELIAQDNEINFLKQQLYKDPSIKIKRRRTGRKHN